MTPIIVVYIQVYGHRDAKQKAERLETKVEATAEVLATKVEEQAQLIAVKTDEIHILVNSRLTEALERIRALEVALGIQEGAAIPGKEE